MMAACEESTAKVFVRSLLATAKGHNWGCLVIDTIAIDLTAEKFLMEHRQAHKIIKIFLLCTPIKGFKNFNLLLHVVKLFLVEHISFDILNLHPVVTSTDMSESTTRSKSQSVWVEGATIRALQSEHECPRPSIASQCTTCAHRYY